jgi:hypothetical protein
VVKAGVHKDQSEEALEVQRNTSSKNTSLFSWWMYSLESSYLPLKTVVFCGFSMEYKNSQKLVSGDTFLIKKKCKRNSIS